MHRKAGLFAACVVWAFASAPDLAPAGSVDANVPLDPAACGEDPAGWAKRALVRSTSPQLGLSPVPHPADNPPSEEKIELGRKIFFDRRLSINNTMSCAMCHVPEQAFVNRELRTSVGVEGRSVKRNAPTIVNAAFLDVLFHDGRDTSLETQFIGPMVARNEMANPSVGLVIAKLRTLPDYAGRFEAAFGAPASLDRLGMALAAYQRSLVLGGSAFDRWKYGKEESALSGKAKRGFEIFTGEAACASCHEIGGRWALFTDQAFHDTGYGWQREQARQNPPETTRVQVAPGVFHDVDYAKVASVSLTREGDIGRYEVTEDPEDRWKFRTPPLRNVAMTPPYMHDGALATLAEVVSFYDSGGPGHSRQDPRIRPLGLREDDREALVAFLEALTSPGLECLAAEARVHPPDNH